MKQIIIEILVLWTFVSMFTSVFSMMALIVLIAEFIIIGYIQDYYLPLFIISIPAYILFICYLVNIIKDYLKKTDN